MKTDRKRRRREGLSVTPVLSHCRTSYYCVSPFLIPRLRSIPKPKGGQKL